MNDKTNQTRRSEADRYVLGELSPAERDHVEAMLRDDEAARLAVEEIRATATLLTDDLRGELERDPAYHGLQPVRSRARAGSPWYRRSAQRAHAVDHRRCRRCGGERCDWCWWSMFRPQLNRAREVAVARGPVASPSRLASARDTRFDSSQLTPQQPAPQSRTETKREWGE
jgi:anti-sigma factor RsiW